MSPALPSIILQGLGSYVPPRILTNAELSAMVDTSDEWIVSRTGIRERRIAGPAETTSDMAVAAARLAIADAGLEPSQIDMIIVGTITPDMPFPSTACLVQKKLGLADIPCFDIEAACSGFLYLLDVGQALLRAQPRYRHILVIGSEKLSSIMDWTDRSTCVLFGDGAGAAVLSRSSRPGIGLLDTILGADGSEPSLLCIPAGGSQIPASEDTLRQGLHSMKMNGKEVFKFASRILVDATRQILQSLSLSLDQIDLIVPHQANIRIIENASKAMGVPMDRFFINLDRYGNTSAASVPLALDEARRAGLTPPGSTVLMIGFGAGLTWGSSVVKWQ